MNTGRRTIANGDKYNALFPKCKGQRILLKEFATLEDTVKSMKQVIAITLVDTYKIAQLLKASTTEKTLHNIWSFCFAHLQYKKDEEGIEQVRRPSHSWKDRHTGVDCDCMSIFIGSILTNLNIPFSIRLTKYESKEFEHVYPIVHLP